MVCLFANAFRIVKNNSKNTDFLSNAGVYKIRCQNFNNFDIGEIIRNLSKRIYEHKKDFNPGNTKNSLVSYNILTKHTFDFQNSAIFALIHDDHKRRRIEACSIAHHNTIPPHNTTTAKFFFKISPFIGKILKEFKIHAIDWLLFLWTFKATKRYKSVSQTTKRHSL